VWVPANTPRSVTLRFNGERLTVQTRGAGRAIIGEVLHD
jgi:hypothetical protein